MCAPLKALIFVLNRMMSNSTAWVQQNGRKVTFGSRQMPSSQTSCQFSSPKLHNYPVFIYVLYIAAELWSSTVYIILLFVCICNVADLYVGGPWHAAPFGSQDKWTSVLKVRFSCAPCTRPLIRWDVPNILQWVQLCARTRQAHWMVGSTAAMASMFLTPVLRDTCAYAHMCFNFYYILTSSPLSCVYIDSAR